MATAVSQGILSEHTLAQPTSSRTDGNLGLISHVAGKQCTASVPNESNVIVSKVSDADQGSNNRSTTATPSAGKSAKIFDNKNFVEAPIPSKNPWNKKSGESSPHAPTPSATGINYNMTNYTCTSKVKLGFSFGY